MFFFHSLVPSPSPPAPRSGQSAVLGRRRNPLDVSEPLARFYQPSGLDRPERDWLDWTIPKRFRMRTVRLPDRRCDDDGCPFGISDVRTYHGPGNTHVKRQARVPPCNRASINRRCRVGRAGGGEIVESTAPVRRRSRGYEWHRSDIWVSGLGVHTTTLSMAPPVAVYRVGVAVPLFLSPSVSPCPSFLPSP
jgi:hypothetical protein